MRNTLKASLLVILFFYGCAKAPEFHSKEEFLHYLKTEKNDYSQTKIINGVKMTVSFRPTELIVNQEIKGRKLKDEAIDSLEAKYDRYLYFTLSYSKNENEILSSIQDSREHFNDVQNILTFGMKEQVVLTNEKRDTIKMIDYNFPRTYGMSRATALLFVFEKDGYGKDREKINFRVSDIGLGTGDVTFSFPGAIVQKHAFNN